MMQPQPPLDLDRIRCTFAVARALINVGRERPPNRWVEHYSHDVRLLLAELDRLRERVVELETRQEANRG